MKSNLSWTLTVLLLALPELVRMSAPPPPPSRPVCGPKANNATCKGSIDGPCCSTSGFCGRTNNYCGAGYCLSGDCKVPYEKVSKDGTCGPSFNNWICGDREWGACCSVYGRCGADELHCGAQVCVSGPCLKEAPGAVGASVDGRCGVVNNKTCTGPAVGTYGACCSNFGWCGNETEHCGKANCHSGKCLLV